jgi:hypothetical protein
MLIQEVLAIHSQHAAQGSHADILGDGFLMEHNPLYRNIKSEAVKLCCRFAEAWPEYLLMPFQQLGEIVAKKKIPYVPSARLLRALENQRAGVLSIEDIAIPESYHLHEAAHVLADHSFAGETFTDPQQKILKALLCESFANTVDALVCVSIHSDIHQFLLQQNCYMRPEKKFVSAMSRVKQACGMRFTFMYTLIAYLHANFLRETLPAEIVEDLTTRFAPDVKLTERLLKDFELLQRMAETLDPRFRFLTTKVYLSLEGYDGEVQELLDFPFMKVFASDERFRKAAEGMAKLIPD